MKTFAFAQKRASPSPRQRCPAVRPLGPRVRAQRAEIRHILHGPRVQAKLKIGAPDDAYEREADRVADQVMRMPEAERTPPVRREEDMAIQRLCTECEEEVRLQPMEEEEEELVRTKARPGATPEVTPDLDSRIQALRGGGQPLPDSERAFFEPRLGYDFSKVRIHTDGRAVEAAQAVNAQAFTVGRDVAFGTAEYAPGTSQGRRLLAHELTHVVQQVGTAGGRTILRKPTGSKTPKYSGCSINNTLTPRANQILESARQRAKDYVEVTIRDLKRAPTRSHPNKAYRAALRRHFASPSAEQREKIREAYEKMLPWLKTPSKFICVGPERCEDEWAAFWSSGKVHLCPTFWILKRKCRAITLIHEAAHAVDVEGAGKHPPYRGQHEPRDDPEAPIPYPADAAAPPEGETAAKRMKNPDAYGYFAAHVWRETDITDICYRSVGGFLMIPGQTIEIMDKLPEAGEGEG